MRSRSTVSAQVSPGTRLCAVARETLVSALISTGDGDGVTGSEVLEDRETRAEVLRINATEETRV